MTSAPQGESEDHCQDSPEERLAERITRLHKEYGEQLRRFLWGVLRDSQLANDCVQVTFVKMMESGGPDRQEAEKAWLFRVAYHAAMAVRRREAVGRRVEQKLSEVTPQESPAADQAASAGEQQGRVREAVRQLPSEQQQIVRMRMYEDKTFAEIAVELGIPLGTALSRMRAALKKLRAALGENE